MENKPKQRGGKREGAGAKPKGNVLYQRRINPKLVPLMDAYLESIKIKKIN